MTKEEKARAAATQWCRCHKCDGIAHNFISEGLGEVTFKCDRDKLQPCHAWYNGYRTALMALSMEEPINEEELNELARQEQIKLVSYSGQNLLSQRNKEHADLHNVYDLMDRMYKAGYHKAKEL